MSSFTVHGFHPANLFESPQPLGRGTNKDLLQIVQGHSYEVPYFHTVRGTDLVGNTNLRDIAIELTGAISMASSAGSLHPSYRDKCVQFVTDVNVLIQKRNEKIDASGWIAFLDVLLKILTLGLFSYKENLKAPMLNPTHWTNACNPSSYTFSLNQTLSKVSRVDISNPGTYTSWDFDEHERVLLTRFFASDFVLDIGYVTPGAGTPNPPPVMERSRWSLAQLKELSETYKRLNISTPFFENSSGELDFTDLRAIDFLFNGGLISSGILVLRDKGQTVLQVGIRKANNGDYALLILSVDKYRYTAGGPLHIEQALPQRFQIDGLSPSFIPLGPLHIRKEEGTVDWKELFEPNFYKPSIFATWSKSAAYDNQGMINRFFSGPDLPEEADIMETFTGPTTPQKCVTIESEMKNMTCYEVDKLFNKGSVANGIITCDSQECFGIIGVRKRVDGRFALLAITDKICTYRLENLVHARYILPKEFQEKNLSFSLKRLNFS